MQLPRGEHLGGCGVTAVYRAEGDAFLGDPAPLAACFLAFFGGEAGEEVLEVRVAPVMPVELAVTAHQPSVIAGRAGSGDHLAIGLRREQHMGRGETAIVGGRCERRQQRGRHGRMIEIRAHQQPRPGRGRERRGNHQLRVVLQPVAGIGLRPREIEDVLAVGMRLQPTGSGGRQPLVVAERDDERLPTAASADAAAFGERGQEGVAQERVSRVAERIPSVRRDVLDPLEESGAHQALSNRSR